MQEVLIGLQFSALIPILVVLIYKPSLNLFFKLLLASIILSIVFDALGTLFIILFKNNITLFCFYCIFNSILSVFLWQKVPFYSSEDKNLIRLLGYVFIGAMIILCFYFKFTNEALYSVSSLNIFLGLILALHYYYQKINLASYTPLLRDPYFITATAYILFCLSTIIILAAQLHFENKPFFTYTWLLRQMFYLVYNIIIGYAFYVLFKTQQIQK